MHESCLGLLDHVEEVETLCEEYPSTVVILDHFGFCKASARAWEKLLSWAKYPQARNMSDL